MTYMSVEHVNDILLARAKLYPGRGNAFSNVPVPPPEGRRAPVERVLEEAAADNGPAAEDGEAAAPDSGVVELAVREDVAGGGADGLVVGGHPALLQADNVRPRLEEGELATDLGEARGALGGDVQEAPAV